MPWKDYDVQHERMNFINDWKAEDFNLSELCEMYAITRKTGYKWIDRYEAEGSPGLQDRSRAPRQHPNQVSPEMEDGVIAIRGKHPRWGAPKIRVKLGREWPEQVIPAESTIGEILKRHGLTVARKKRHRSRGGEQKLESSTGPNQVWCTDYKGWFRTADGQRVDPLTLTDHYSRYLLRCQAVRAADYLHTKAVIEAAFREYGLPERMRMDNGAPFGSNGESGLTGLTVWWIKLGIIPEHIEPGKPEQNGRHERMHRTLKQETASPPAATRKAQQERFDAFRKEYNQERPHEGVQQKTPTEVYQCSARSYPVKLPEVEYPADWVVHRVSPGGQIRWKNGYVFVAHPLAGERVGLKQVDERCWRVWFSFYEIGMLDTAKLKIRRPPRKANDEEGRG